MGPQGPVGQLTQALGLGRLPFTFGGLVVASVLYSMPFVVQPLQQAFEAIPERTAGSRRHAARRALGPLLQRGAAAGAAGLRHRQRAGLRAHRGRVRRGADDRRQHPGPARACCRWRSTTMSRPASSPQAHRLAAGMVVFALVVLVTLYVVNRPPRRRRGGRTMIEARLRLQRRDFPLDVALAIARRAASPRCSAPRAAARPRCCAHWPGWSAPPGAWRWTARSGRTTPAGRFVPTHQRAAGLCDPGGGAVPAPGRARQPALRPPAQRRRRAQRIALDAVVELLGIGHAAGAAHRPRCRAASASAWRSPARWPPARACC